MKIRPAPLRRPSALRRPLPIGNSPCRFRGTRISHPDLKLGAEVNWSDVDVFECLGSDEALFKMIYFTGLGGIFHGERMEVKSFLNRGYEVFGQRSKFLKHKEQQAKRAMSELFNHEELLEGRLKFLTAVQNKLAWGDPAPFDKRRIGLLASSFALWYVIQMAKERPHLFNPMNAVVFASPYFAVRRRMMTKIYLRYHSMEPLRSLLRQSREDFDIFAQMALSQNLSVGFVVPGRDNTAKPNITQKMYQALPEGLDCSALVVPEAKHFPFSSNTPKPLRKVIYAYLDFLFKGQSLDDFVIDHRLQDQGVTLIRGQEPWPRFKFLI